MNTEELELLNDFTDHAIFTLFYRSAYKTPPKSEMGILFNNRKIKLKTLKRKIKLKKNKNAKNDLEYIKI